MKIEEIDWTFENQDILSFHREGETVVREVTVNVLGNYFKERDIPINEMCNFTHFIDDVEKEVMDHTWWVIQLLIDARFKFAIDYLKNFILRNIHVLNLGIGSPGFIFDVR